MKLYCDYSATTPILPEALVAMMPYFIDKFGNPSSVYSLGREAKMAIEGSRCVISSILNCSPEEIIFTSGGTESDNFAIKGIAQAKGKKGLYITTKIEHPAVLNCFKELEDNGYRVLYLDVDKNGFIKLGQLKELMDNKEKINFVSIMYANNELGTIQYIEQIGSLLKEYDETIIYHTDAVQAVGKVKFNLQDSTIDLLSASGHKFGANKGVGFLYKKSNVDIHIQNLGGGQESNFRSGTENVASIVGMSKALEVHDKQIRLDKEQERWNNTELQEKEMYLIYLLKKNIDNCYLNSPSEDKIDGVINIRFDGIDAQALLTYLDNRDICVSAGSACHSDSDTPSHVLKAIGLTDEEALSSIRISFDNSITTTEIEYLAHNIKEGVEYLKNF